MTHTGRRVILSIMCINPMGNFLLCDFVFSSNSSISLFPNYLSLVDVSRPTEVKKGIREDDALPHHLPERFVPEDEAYPRPLSKTSTFSTDSSSTEDPDEDKDPFSDDESDTDYFFPAPRQ